MTNEIKFPNANEEQNKILNMIANQRAKEEKAKQKAFDAEKDKEEFLFLWRHFRDRLNKMLDDFVDDSYGTGYHGLEIVFKIKKDDSKDSIVEKFIYNDKLKMFKVTEID